MLAGQVLVRDAEARGIVRALVGELDARHVLASHPGREPWQVLPPVEVRVDEHAVTAEAASGEDVEVGEDAAGRRGERRDGVEQAESERAGSSPARLEQRRGDAGDGEDQEGVRGQ